MKEIVLTTEELTKLGLIKIEEPKKVRIILIEEKPLDSGIVVATNDKSLSRNR